VTYRVLIVPHGCGIGDFVNLQPLVRAISMARPGSCIDVLGSPDLSVLLPSTVRIVPWAAGIPYWRRMGGTRSRELFSWVVTSRTVGPLARMVPLRSMTGLMTWYLERAGYNEVFNFLEVFVGCRPGERWTGGPWNPPTMHVIDVLANDLETRGISLSRSARRPTLAGSGYAANDGLILLQVGAGNSLKALPLSHWSALAHDLLRVGMRVGVISSSSDGRGERLARSAPGLQVIWTPTLEKLLRALGPARLVVSPDTGVLHISAALGTPYLGLFGPTDPCFLGPYLAHPDSLLQVSAMHGRTCRGCWAAQMFPTAGCGMGYRGGCIASLGADVIAEAVRRRLSAQPFMSVKG
jgi:ADP-heptose:LPS heptosyltransferase